MEIYDESSLTPYELLRQNNIIRNYEFMKACGLPVKPLVYIKQNKDKVTPDFTRKVESQKKFLELKKQLKKKTVKKTESTSENLIRKRQRISKYEEIKNKRYPKRGTRKNYKEADVPDEDIHNSKSKVNNISTHVKICSGGKPFKCTYCDYECIQKYNLVRHVKIHTGEKPFKCTYCDYECTQKTHLTRHLKFHSGEKPFKCTYCDYKCTQKSTLPRHVMTHTGEKPFKCAYCDYKCAQKSDLTRHVKTHTGEKN
ncbi:zinc finger protein 260 isoform X2 [Hydra vulgaris]|uniref:zinc finger protein 260 isoform X2 n=1 Tax=Hydra vulgaris TaxID=6087 RepID=UPI001F5F011C|nr:zinc finger protein 260-like isoform X2 [Hydra vulgaris]XP_047143627.1 zinc finger protein 260-like isoform X2 [Hydra vulgaris]